MILLPPRTGDATSNGRGIAEGHRDQTLVRAAWLGLQPGRWARNGAVSDRTFWPNFEKPRSRANPGLLSAWKSERWPAPSELLCQAPVPLRPWKESGDVNRGCPGAIGQTKASSERSPVIQHVPPFLHG